MVYCLIIIKLLFKTSARASRIFSELDINGDGELSCDEFIRGCMQVHEYVSWSNYGVYNYIWFWRELWHINFWIQDKDLIRMLSSGGLHPDEAEADDYCWLGVSENSWPCVGLQKHNTSIHSSPFYKQYLYFVLLYQCILK